jgi:glycine/D-amino acid oxidase-like deaminating enzyme
MTADEERQPGGPAWGEPVWGRAASRPEAGLPLRADVVVVGAGITGVSLAYWLARGGADVLVLERSRLAAGASGRNAGFLLAGVAASYADAVASYGRGLAAEVWAFTLENHDRLAEVLTGRAGHYRGGCWTLAASPQEAEMLERSAQLLAEDGLPGEWLPGARVLGGPLGGMLNPLDGEIHPVALVETLALESGVPVIEGVDVVAMEPDASGVRVHTSRGELAAGAVVLATNGYTRQLMAALPIDPVRAQMLATGGTGRVADRPVYTDGGYVYWRQLLDHKVILGGFRHRAAADEVGYAEQPTETIQAYLDGHLKTLGVAAPVTHRWAGVMGFTPDALPLVGAVPGSPGVYISAGYSGHGMGFAFNCARVLAEKMLGGPPPPAWLDPSRVVARA